jgi:non-homologous end joining protein Ku
LWRASTEAQTVRFNMINPKIDNRIRMQTVGAGTGEQVSRSELVKGFEVAKGEYVLFDKGARRGEARIDPHHREIRAALLQQAESVDCPLRQSTREDLQRSGVEWRVPRSSSRLTSRSR